MRTVFLAATALASVLSAGAARADDAGDAAPVETVEVIGQRAPTTSTAATKTATPLAETPQSITVVTDDFIQRLQLQNLDEALRYVAGVTPEQRGASAEVYDLFALRGFGAPVFLDGLFYVSQSDATGYAAAQADISRLDRVDVIKGPSSVLYGRSGPGGLVVEQSKLPLPRSLYGSMQAVGGNFDLYRFDGDLGGRAGEHVLWRVYGSANGAHDQQQYGRRERQTLSAAATIGDGTPTTLTLLAAYSHDPRNGNYGVFPALGTLFPNPRGPISRNFYGGEPGDFFSREQLGFTYILTHDFGNGWAFKASGRRQYVRSALGLVYTQGAPVDAADPAPALYGRASYSTHEQNKDWVFDHQLTGAVRTGPFKHDLLFGSDRQVLEFYEHGAFGTATPINVYAPVYGTMPTPQDPEQVPGSYGVFQQNTRQRQQSVYAQDQISWGGLRVTLSGRQDWSRQSGNTVATQHDDDFTYRTAALYRFDNGVAPYVTYSTSFQPQAARLVDGTLARPSEGEQIEGGVKYQAPRLPVTLSAAYFHIVQTNVLSYDPVSFAATQSGRVRSQGFELEGEARLPLDLAARIAFSRQSVRILEDQDPAAVGHGLPTVGRGGVTANLDWTPRAGRLRGLSVGGAVRFVDRVYAYSAYNTPSYTLVDAVVSYDLGALSPRLHGVDLSLNVKNIGDSHYLTSCYVNYQWCWYGARRTVQGAVRWSF